MPMLCKPCTVYKRLVAVINVYTDYYVLVLSNIKFAITWSFFVEISSILFADQ